MIGEQSPLDIVDFASGESNVFYIYPVLFEEFVHVNDDVVVDWINEWLLSWYPSRVKRTLVYRFQ